MAETSIKTSVGIPLQPQTHGSPTGKTKNKKNCSLPRKHSQLKTKQDKNCNI